MFGLRFDIDSRYGLTRRLPDLLEVLAKHRAKATFFCVMGRDPSVLEILRLRTMGTRPLGHDPATRPADREPIAAVPIRAPGRSHFLRNPAKILYTASYPRRVGTARPDILENLVHLGHEVYPHGWSHIQWQRNLENIDVDRHIRLCIEAYQEIFACRPAGFASPGMIFNQKVLDAFDAYGLSFVGDMSGEAPFTPDGHRVLQIPVTTRRTISWLSWRGYGSSDIVDLLFRHIADREFSVIFDHPDNMGAHELGVLDELLERLTVIGKVSTPFSRIFESTVRQAAR